LGDVELEIGLAGSFVLGRSRGGVFRVDIAGRSSLLRGGSEIIANVRLLGVWGDGEGRGGRDRLRRDRVVQDRREEVVMECHCREGYPSGHDNMMADIAALTKNSP
jgi:hypothetical protein